MNDRTNNIPAGGFTCVAMNDGSACGAEGTAVNIPDMSYALFLCDPHRAELYNRSDLEYRAREDVRSYRDRNLPSFVYVVRLSSGHVKIGYTTRLGDRLANVSETYNHGKPVEVLAVMEGDQHLEGRLHHEWKDVRVMEEFGEQHYATPELMEWIEGLDTTPLASSELAVFASWSQEDAFTRSFNRLVRASELEKRRGAESEGQKMRREASTARSRIRREEKRIREKPERLAQYIQSAQKERGEIHVHGHIN